MLSDRVNPKAPKDANDRSRKLPLKRTSERSAAKTKPAYNGEAFGSFLGACP